MRWFFLLIGLIDPLFVYVCVAFRSLSFVCVWFDALFGIVVVRRIHIDVRRQMDRFQVGVVKVDLRCGFV
jgi:hypothetical protein